MLPALQGPFGTHQSASEAISLLNVFFRSVAPQRPTCVTAQFCLPRADKSSKVMLKITNDGSAVGFDGSMLNGPEEIASTLGQIFANHPTAPYVAKGRKHEEFNAISRCLSTYGDREFLLTGARMPAAHQARLTQCPLGLAGFYVHGYQNGFAQPD